MTATLDHTMTPPFAFEPPGPGAWTLDADHQATTRGALMQELFTHNFVAGTQSCFSRYGMPLDRLEGRHVNGWFYVHPVPAGVPDNGRTPPPAPILRVATRVLPELRRRRRTAVETVAVRRWLVDARTWGSERQEWLARSDALLAVELDLLDDAALADHLREALALAGEMIQRHFGLIGVAVGVGRLLVAGRAWGLAPDEIIELLRGSSPASSASRLPLAELSELAQGRTGPQTVEGLRSLSPRAAELVDFYLRRYGWLPLADDVEATTLAEHPDQLVELVRAQRNATVEHPSIDPLDRLRTRVPADDRARLDQLVSDARECYASLDDNSGITALTIGVVRRVALEAGRRGARSGAIEVAADVFNLTPSELTALAGGADPIGPDEFASRRARRAASDRRPPPPVLGGPIVEPPDPGVFPGPVAELAAAIGAYLDLKFTARSDRSVSEAAGTLEVHGEAPVTGVPVVTGTATGRIVVSGDAADAVARIEPGDILVCPYTSAAHNAIFPMLAGVLTQFGGPLGHTAVMAREFGIPAVVGARSLPLHLDELLGTLVAPPTT